jgi:hypothetical protein
MSVSSMNLIDISLSCQSRFLRVRKSCTLHINTPMSAFFGTWYNRILGVPLQQLQHERCLPGSLQRPYPGLWNSSLLPAH